MENINDEIGRFEVGTIINDNRNTILASSDLELANFVYERKVQDIIDYGNNKTTNHIIVFLYDYDKNANINYFDNETDLL